MRPHFDLLGGRFSERIRVKSKEEKAKKEYISVRYKTDINRDALPAWNTRFVQSQILTRESKDEQSQFLIEKQYGEWIRMGIYSYVEIYRKITPATVASTKSPLKNFKVFFCPCPVSHPLRLTPPGGIATYMSAIAIIDSCLPLAPLLPSYLL
jgi:hypothetical protein